MNYTGFFLFGPTLFMFIQPCAEADYFSQCTLSTALCTDKDINLFEINVYFFYRAYIPYYQMTHNLYLYLSTLLKILFQRMPDHVGHDGHYLPKTLPQKPFFSSFGSVPRYS